MRQSGGFRFFATIMLTALAAIMPLFLGIKSRSPETFHITLDAAWGSLRYSTSKKTVRGALGELGMTTTPGFVNPDLDFPLKNGLTVTYREERPVHIQASDGLHAGRTVADTVAGALWENGVVLGILDRTIPAAYASIGTTETIQYIKIEEVDRVERVSIPFRTITYNNPEMRYGRSRMLKGGVEGVREETVRLRFENGTQALRRVLAKKTIAEPIPQEKEVGTKIEIGRVQEGLASWYAFKGGNFAASTMFPRGTFLRVTELVSGKVAVVEVNDYGPTGPGRVIDLDAVVFKKLAPLWRGVWPVKVEEIL